MNVGPKRVSVNGRGNAGKVADHLRRKSRRSRHLDRRRSISNWAILPFLVLVALIVPVVAVAATSRQEDMPAARHERPSGLPTPPAEVRGSAAQRMAIPILMYHVVSAPKPGTPMAWLWVPESSFRKQMSALKRAGYHAITMRQAYDGWRKGKPLPRRPVVLSFDDGYLSQYTHARPVLRRLRWPGVLNLTIRNIGPRGLSTRQVKALISDGWEVDSHTVKHTNLTADGPKQLHHELVDSRRELRRRFGVRADFFCYPSGRFNDQVIAAVRAAGYLAATTTRQGYATGSDMYALRRIKVDGSESARDLMHKLAAERPHS
jgi:peptidoglycan/xylan/chitin deacetylase (PgdA/CDA1 family)